MKRTGVLLFAVATLPFCGDSSEPPADEPVPEDTALLCSNDVDDDGDGDVDCGDSDCEAWCAGDSDTDVDTDTDTPTPTEEPDPCDPIEDTGCEVDEVCKVLWADREPDVVCARPGDTALGDACETSTDCQGNMTCWEACRAPCHVAGDCQGVPAGPFDASRCVNVSGGWGYCTLPCDPFLPAECGGGAQCMLVIDGDRATTDCTTSPGSGEVGDACMQPLDCRPGTACDDDPAGGFTCGTVCSGDGDCGDDSCRLLTSEAGGDIGTCR